MFNVPEGFDPKRSTPQPEANDRWYHKVFYSAIALLPISVTAMFGIGGIQHIQSQQDGGRQATPVVAPPAPKLEKPTETTKPDAKLTDQSFSQAALGATLAQQSTRSLSQLETSHQFHRRRDLSRS